MAIRHAAAVASASIEKMLGTAEHTSEMVHLQRQLIEFQMCLHASELAFLDVLVRMSDDLKLAIIFELFDDDCSGEISVEEFALCLQKMDKSKTFNESLHAAILSRTAFDVNEDGMLDLPEFGLFLTDLVVALECPFNDLAQLMAMRVAFDDHGTSVLDAGIVALVQDASEALSNPQKYNDAVMEVRMLLLFQVLANQDTGLARFEDVVKSLVNATKDMDETPRQALLMCDHRSAERTLDYDQFSELLLNVVMAGNLVFHEVANSMTFALSKQGGTKIELGALFLGDEMLKISSNENKSEQPEGNITDSVEYGRMCRLFDLWDLDHSGTLEFSEFALGMRKFQQAKDMESTVDDTVAALMSFDTDGDQQLDKNEFAQFLVQFAASCNVPISDLLDFMVVSSSLKDNSEAEADYIASIKERTTSQMRQKARAANNHGGLFGTFWAK
jgi:Ca2+-binding EF-hand superfamily protein